MSAAVDLPPLKLKRGEERRLAAGHLWVFSNEVDTAATPLKSFEPGALAVVRDHRDGFVGYAYVNPNTLICARLLGTEPGAPPDRRWFAARLREALKLRARFYPQPAYRLAFGEADRLPGLIVDRFGDVLVVQTSTAGMERLRSIVFEALEEVLEPRAIVLKNDSSARDLEGLERYLEIVCGEVEDAVELEELGARFRVPILSGQKTGWYFDQQGNRERLLRYVAGARVLDVCSYIGAWAVTALRHGAIEACCIDSSAAALERAVENSRLNGFHLETVHGDASTVLARLAEAGERYDIVVVDPPAFVKRRRDLAKGKAAYRRLNHLAMQLLVSDGLLVSCSCSFHMSAADLVETLRRAGQQARRFVQVLELGGQGLDHPVHPAIPETRYLTAAYCRVL